MMAEMTSDNATLQLWHHVYCNEASPMPTLIIMCRLVSMHKDASLGNELPDKAKWNICRLLRRSTAQDIFDLAADSVGSTGCMSISFRSQKA